MPPNLDQFVRLSDAPDKFNVSMTTLRRKRDKARDTDDQDIYAHFIVKTRDGEIYEHPSSEVTTKLNKEGRSPEWLVDHAWLQIQYGVRVTTDTPKHPSDSDHEQSPPPSKEQPDDATKQPEQSSDQPEQPKLDPLVQALINSKNEQIEDLKKRLDDSRQDNNKREESLTEISKSLTNLLPALNPEIEQPTQSGEAKNQLVDTTPKQQPVKQKPRTNPKRPKANKTTPEKQPNNAPETKTRKGFGRWLLGSRKPN